MLWALSHGYRVIQKEGHLMINLSFDEASKVQGAYLKYVGAIILLFVFCYLQSTTTYSSSGNMNTLFQGAEPGARAYAFLLFYFGFTIPSFLVYSCATDFVGGYGTLLVYRYQSRMILFNFSLKKILCVLAVVLFFKFLIYGVILFLKNGMQMPYADLMTMYYGFWDFISLSLFLSIQTILELLISPQISLLLSHVSFLVVMASSDILMVRHPDIWINKIVPMNHQMIGRFHCLPDDCSFNAITVSLATLLTAVVIYFTGAWRFLRKDII